MGVAPAGADIAWVTGATSFLGCHVARSLAQNGYRVVGFAWRSVPGDIAASWGFDAIEVGPFLPAFLDGAIGRLGGPTVIFHAIGSGSVSQALADPQADTARTLGTLESLGAVLRNLKHKVRLLYPSSAAAYGVSGADPIPETAPTCSVSVYGQTKLAAEAVCRQGASDYGYEIVILRLFSVYGSPQRKLLFWELGRRILSGERAITLGGSGMETRDFIHVTDAAKAIALLAHVPAPPQIVNVGSGRATSIERATALFGSALGVSAEIEFSGVKRPGDPPHQRADIARVRAYGFEPEVELDAGLGEYAAWLRESAISDE